VNERESIDEAQEEGDCWGQNAGSAKNQTHKEERFGAQRILGIFRLFPQVWAGAEMRVQAGILMSLQFDLSGEIRRKLDRSQMSRKY